MGCGVGLRAAGQVSQSVHGLGAAGELSENQPRAALERCRPLFITATKRLISVPVRDDRLVVADLLVPRVLHLLGLERLRAHARRHVLRPRPDEDVVVGLCAAAALELRKKTQRERLHLLCVPRSAACVSRRSSLRPKVGSHLPAETSCTPPLQIVPSATTTSSYSLITGVMFRSQQRTTRHGCRLLAASRSVASLSCARSWSAHSLTWASAIGLPPEYSDDFSSCSASRMTSQPLVVCAAPMCSGLPSGSSSSA